MSEKLVLIDGHSILNRAFYGVPDLSNSEGLHTNAIYGFLNILFKLLEEEKPEYLTVRKRPRTGKLCVRRRRLGCARERKIPAHPQEAFPGMEPG